MTVAFPLAQGKQETASDAVIGLINRTVSQFNVSIANYITKILLSHSRTLSLSLSLSLKILERTHIISMAACTLDCSLNMEVYRSKNPLGESMGAIEIRMR